MKSNIRELLTIMYECRPTGRGKKRTCTPIKHVWSTQKDKTRCGVKPTPAEYDRGTFSFEHGWEEPEKYCSKCWEGL